MKEVYALGSMSSAPIVAFVMLAFTLLPLYGAVKQLRRDDPAARALGKLLAVTAVAIGAAGAFVTSTAYSDYAVVAVGDESISVGYPAPVGEQVRPAGSVETVRVLKNIHGYRRHWILELAFRDGSRHVSEPAGRPDSVLAAADGVAQASGVPVTWGIRRSRGGDLEDASEEQVRSEE